MRKLAGTTWGANEHIRKTVRQGMRSSFVHEAKKLDGEFAPELTIPDSPRQRRYIINPLGNDPSSVTVRLAVPHLDRGKQEDEGNEEADQLTNLGAQSQQPTTHVSNKEEDAFHHLDRSKQVMLTATTKAKAPDGEKFENVRIILDSGSRRTYVTEYLARRLGLKEEEEIQLVTFGSKNTKIIKTRSTRLEIKSKDGKYMTLSANIIPSITGTIHRNQIKFHSPNKFAELTRNLSLADTIPTQNETIKIDLLIGNDFYLEIIRSEKIEVQPGLYLLSSCLGWILTGRTQPKEQTKMNDINMFILTYGNNVTETSVFGSVDDALQTKPNIEDFWNMEVIGITDNADKSGDEITMSHFQKTVKCSDDGRYEVTWPWKDEFPELPENRGLALERLRSLSGKLLQRQPELLEKYDSVIQDQLDKRVIEKVERSQCDGMKHYTPHHVVKKPEKSTTKLRIVYDASAKTRKEHKSLNECLYRGPVLLRDLCGILLRFRLNKIGMVSDIEKAFLQVRLQTQERDVTRFLWFKTCDNPVVDEKDIQEYRFCRVPVGIISSPFLLGATIEHHLDLYSSPLAEQLKEGIYMDNVITGAETVEGAIDLYRNAKSMFSGAKMNLRQWLTNNEDVNNEIPEDDKDLKIKV
ncbi:uncharacterized protein LOC128559229 [Mercenaria mercenaria]|uniref:uncharacterized protein LOC128559229 n=1 Tax=Mercenaria mercenaria TaxID=6596 RepID=UPI00234F1F6F|nr:uncharacterized protein LOC128559229 [Mercenaria mercenaria]